MKDESKIENKVMLPYENKAPQKKVLVRVNPRRAVVGVGAEGETKRIDSDLAQDLQAEGLVTILE